MSENSQNRSFIKMCVAIYSGAIVIAVIWSYFFHSNLYDSAGFIDYYIYGQTPLIKQCLLGIFIAVWVILLSIYLGYRYTWVKSFEAEVKSIVGDLSALDILLVAIFSSIGEELLFRAAIQPSLGLLVTGILFGVLHFPFSKKLIFYPFFAMIMGFILGYMTIIHHGAITSAIIAHALINFINLYRINSSKKL